MLKSSIFKFSIWALLLLSASTTASASPEDSLTRYDRRILRYRKHWDVLMPTQSVIQTCGNMGIISLGIGWDYGKRSQWETHLLFGIVPKYDSDEVKMTITLKENFIPWRKDWGKGWQFEPPGVHAVPEHGTGSRFLDKAAYQVRERILPFLYPNPPESGIWRTVYVSGSEQQAQAHQEPHVLL